MVVRFGALTMLVLVLGGSPECAHAHGGGLDANGCHTNRKTGDYHSHLDRDGDGVACE